MNRRMLAIAGGVILAVGAVIAGTVIVVSQDSDSSSTAPTGTRSALRIHAVNEEVSCGRIAAVRIYLDDLEFRASQLDPAAPAGAIAFELPLRYDPSVLRLLNGSDVQLNQALGQQDVDNDGVVRDFIPVHYISEDHLGRVTIGAVSLVTALGREEDRLEEGIDPVAKGEPLLLATLLFTPVGEGTTSVRIEEWSNEARNYAASLVDANTVNYEDVTFASANVSVSGGDCPGLPPTPTVPPTPTIVVVPTRTTIPTPVVPDGVRASDIGRDDCNPDWFGHESDSEFSICFPPTADIRIGPPDADLSEVLRVELGPHTRITMYSRPNSYFTGLEDFTTCDLPPSWDDKRVSSVAIGDVLVDGCVGLETMLAPDSPPLTRTFAEVPVWNGRYVTVFMTEPQGLDYEADRELLNNVVESIRFEESMTQ